MLDADTIAGVVDMTEGRALDFIEEGCKLSLMGYELDEIRDRVQGIPGLILVGDETETAEEDE